MGRQERASGVPGGQRGSGTEAGKKRTELPLGKERALLSPEGEGKGREERERGHEEGGSPWARGHAPGKRGRTRGAEDPDTREEILDLPPGRGEGRAAAPGGPCARGRPDRTRPAAPPSSLFSLPRSLPPTSGPLSRGRRTHQRLHLSPPLPQLLPAPPQPPPPPPRC